MAASEDNTRARRIDQFLATIGYLPPAPQVLPKLLPLLADPDTESERIVELIRFDASLTAQVLQASNSAVLAPSQRTTDLVEAVAVLGFREVYRLVAIVAGLSLLRVSTAGYGINAQELWRHSVGAAIAAQLIARQIRQDESVAFTGGLLHDIGKIILAEQFRERYASLVARAKEEQRPLVDLEQEVVRMEHAEVGGRLLARWNFADNVTDCVRFHHQPEAAHPAYQHLTACVCVGNYISRSLELPESSAAYESGSYGRALAIARLSADDLPAVVERTRQDLQQIPPLYRSQT
jgi:putative nucleotidyltransferase with HDIG domain